MPLPTEEEVIYALGIATRALTVSELAQRMGVPNQERTVRNRLYSLQRQGRVTIQDDGYPQTWMIIGGGR